MNLLPDKPLLINVPYPSTKYRKQELCVDNKVQGTFRDVYCPICRNGKCLYISTNKTSIIYECKNCKTCCHVSDIPCEVQKLTIMLSGGDDTHCFTRKTSRDNRKEKSLQLLKKILHQSQSSTPEILPKKANIFLFSTNSCGIHIV